MRLVDIVLVLIFITNRYSMTLNAVLIASFFFLLIHDARADQSLNLYSPDGKIRLGVDLRDNGDLTYSVNYKGKTVTGSSGLGFKLNVPDVSLAKFSLLSTDSSATDETWKPVWGEQSSVRNNYKQLILRVNEKSGPGILMKFIFRVFSGHV